MNESPRNVFKANIGKTLIAGIVLFSALAYFCLLYTSDAADE